MKKILGVFVLAALLFTTSCGEQQSFKDNEPNEVEVTNVVTALLRAGLLAEDWSSLEDESHLSDQSFMRFYTYLQKDYPSEIPEEHFEEIVQGYLDVSADYLHGIEEYDSDSHHYVPSPNIQGDSGVDYNEYLRVDTISMAGERITVEYRVLWGDMAEEGDGSDTAYAGSILMQRQGDYYRVDSVSVTENYSHKYDIPPSDAYSYSGLFQLQFVQEEELEIMAVGASDLDQIPIVGYTVEKMGLVGGRLVISYTDGQNKSLQIYDADTLGFLEKKEFSDCSVCLNSGGIVVVYQDRLEFYDESLQLSGTTDIDEGSAIYEGNYPYQMAEMAGSSHLVWFSPERCVYTMDVESGDEVLFDATQIDGITMMLIDTIYPADENGYICLAATGYTNDSYEPDDSANLYIYVDIATGSVFDYVTVEELEPRNAVFSPNQGTIYIAPELFHKFRSEGWNNNDVTVRRTAQNGIISNEQHSERDAEPFQVFDMGTKRIYQFDNVAASSMRVRLSCSGEGRTYLLLVDNSDETTYLYVA